MSKQKSQQMSLTRRQMMTLMGLGTLCCGQLSPITMVTRSIVDGLIADAQAQSGFPVKRFVSVLLPGAPTRWVWDGFLNPSNETIVANGSVNNSLIQDSYIAADPNTGEFPVNVTYRAVPVSLPNGSQIYLPPLWNSPIPVSDGGTVSMNSLLVNTLIMRGVDAQIDLGHVFGPGKSIYPIGASASLTGLVGDAHADMPLPVVGLRGSYNYADPYYQGYKSLRGTTPTLVNSDVNSLETTLSPFIITDPETRAQLTKLNSAPVQQAITSAMSELGTFARSSMPGSDVLYRNFDGANALFRRSFGDLRNQVYPTLLNKYNDIAQRCARTALPNILPSSGGDIYNFATGRFSSEMAYQFAVAEYLLVQGLSSAISISSGVNARFAGLTSLTDEHVENDRQRSVICQSYKFLSLAAMIYELRRVLMANNLWDSTLVHIASEYNRRPKTDASGSDHAPNASVYTMMSGAIRTPLFIGNIYTNSSAGTAYPGTYGVAAPVLIQTGAPRFITNNTAAATAAAILGVQNPVTQASSVVAVDASGVGVTSLAEAPRNIA